MTANWLRDPRRSGFVRSAVPVCRVPNGGRPSRRHHGRLLTWTAPRRASRPPLTMPSLALVSSVSDRFRLHRRPPHQLPRRRRRRTSRLLPRTRRLLRRVLLTTPPADNPPPLDHPPRPCPSRCAYVARALCSDGPHEDVMRSQIRSVGRKPRRCRLPRGRDSPRCGDYRVDRRPARPLNPRRKRRQLFVEIVGPRVGTSLYPYPTLDRSLRPHEDDRPPVCHFSRRPPGLCVRTVNPERRVLERGIAHYLV